MSQEPSVEALRERALDLVDDDPDEAVRVVEEALRRQPDAKGFYVCGVVLCEVGDAEQGIGALRMALELDPGLDDAAYTLAREEFANFEFEEAREHVSLALRLDPHHPDARYLRACLRERRGDHDGALRDYQSAALSEPVQLPMPVPLDDDEIDAVVESVLSELHPSLQRYLKDVAILVEDVPPLEVLEDIEEGAHPTDLLGCFSGHSLAERDSTDPWSSLPATITIYRRNLARIAQDRDELRGELRVTLLHEIGHFLGLDEVDLAERGLD